MSSLLEPTRQNDYAHTSELDETISDPTSWVAALRQALKQLSEEIDPNADSGPIHSSQFHEHLALSLPACDRH